MHFFRNFAVLAFPLSLGACGGMVSMVGRVGMHKQVVVPPDSAAQCRQQCLALGVELDAIVLATDLIACVCGVGGHGSPVSSSGAAAAVTVLAAQAEEEAARQGQNTQNTSNRRR